jgi:hypothetical protein
VLLVVLNLLTADACVGARIVPANSNDVIATVRTIPIDCFLSFILFFSTSKYFLMSICEVCRLLLYLNFDLSNSIVSNSIDCNVNSEYVVIAFFPVFLVQQNELND